MQQELITRIQAALRDLKVPAWLFYDFRGLDPLAVRILRFAPDYHATRRWFYLVPAEGEPTKLVHRIESSMLDHLPGKKEIYLEWPQLHSKLKAMLAGLPAVAMQYSGKNAIPYISRVDGGTVELVRSCPTEVLSSGDLVQRFESVWTPAQVEQHRSTARTLTSIVNEAFEKAAADVAARGETNELEIQQFIWSRFEEEGWTADSPPIVAVNKNSANPHYQPVAEAYSTIRQGDFLLIDLWAKPKNSESVYADITWVAYFGSPLPGQMAEVFDVVRRARDRGVEFLGERIASGRQSEGWEVDDQVRKVIRDAGYGAFFVHRTGHNLGHEVHGNGVNFDNLETHDTRRVIPGIACTIEPGVYLEDFGVRSELNVYVSDKGPEVTTPPQESVLVLKV